MTYATVEALEVRLRRPIPAAEKPHAEQALEDASLVLDRLCPPLAGADDADVRELVVCRMVARAFATAPDMMGVTSMQEGTGPFQTSLTFTNPMGDLYLTKAEKKLLGYGGQMVASVAMRSQRTTWLERFLDEGHWSTTIGQEP